ncbi:CDP-glycerol glycerophosphotransferase family protein [Virgibacillus halodenitrificans]|nr:CDP-glycerol glycerophosphotransferase family protein [Virgibacillus halodenitrificans]
MNILKKFIFRIYKSLFKFAKVLPVKKKLVIFESYSGKQYSCNPRAIYEYMKENHPEFNMYWSVKKGNQHVFEENKVKYVKRYTLKWLLVMVRAEFWVSNSRLPLWMEKPKHTTYLQTWHGTPLKKLAHDMDEVHMPGTDTFKYKESFSKAVSRWDVLISPNSYSTPIFKRAFQFNKQIIETGYPRNDYLVNKNTKDNISNIKKKLSLPQNKKVILYAPTWRDDFYYGKGRYKFDLMLDINKLKENLGEDYIIILRMHYLVTETFNIKDYEGFVFDYSSYEDIRELYLISDMLITDYSSVFFDYSILKRPVLFYTYDIDKYRDVLRGFYFNIEEKTPDLIVKSNEEIINKIKKWEEGELSLLTEQSLLYNNFCELEDGEAAKRVVHEVFLGK